jgi:hypothetical protein
LSQKYKSSSEEKNRFKDVISLYVSASKEKIPLIKRQNEKPTASK